MTAVRCEHCGGEYDRSFGTHCMANFRRHGQQTELLGRYVTRAEKAEARVKALEAECAQMSEELGLPPTIRPAEGELRRMQRALTRVVALEEAIQMIARLSAKDVAKLPWDVVRACSHAASLANQEPSQATSEESKR